jgi:hypothetical protein
MAPQIDIEKLNISGIRVDTIREIMVNKICTLISRCEIKDLLDLYFLGKHGLEISKHFKDARKKEGGLDSAMISYLLSSINIDKMPDYLLKPLDLIEFTEFVEELKTTLAKLAYPE